MDPAHVRRMIFQRVAELAGTTEATLNDETTLESLGLDSADAVVLAMEIEQLTGTEIDVGLFLRCGTIAEAATEIARGVAVATA